MSVVLLIVGLLATGVGFFALGMGISLQLTFGNALIEAGAISAASGLLMIGMSAILRQLRKIHMALQGHAPARAAETVESMVPPVARMTPAAPPSPVPTRPAAPVRSEFDVPPLPEMFSTPAPQPAEMLRIPEPVRMPEPPPRTIEPRFPVNAVSEPAAAPAPGPLDWLRSKSKPAAAPPMPVRPAAPEPMLPRPVAMEPPVVEVPDEAPLSPRPPQRPSMMPQAPEPGEPKPWQSARPEPAADMAPRVDLPTPVRPAPQPEPAKEGFDLVWPDRATTAAPSSEAAKREPALDMPLPPVPARPRDSKPADRRPPGPARMAAERSPAILKSGVIDGMPYTLYADGSIEAELPQGTVKFASVDALRSHLEKQS